MHADSSKRDAEAICDLAKYHISTERGFMLEEPLAALPEYFEQWNELAQSLPDLIKNKRVRDAVAQLPVLNHNLLQGHRQLRLAHLQLCFIAAGYVWQDGDMGVPLSLPACLAVPFYKISKKLGVQPILGHVDLALSNWARKDPNGPLEFHNLKCLCHIPGGWEGDWFCIVTFMVEFTFAKCLKSVVRVKELLSAARNQKKIDETAALITEQEIIESLCDIRRVIQSIQAVLARMHDHLTASTFFNVLRPFLGGWGGNGNPIPEGIIYEGVSETPIKLSGGSAAQSSSLQVLDAFLGVEHTTDKKQFLFLMRDYMPPDHKRFIEDLEQSPYQLRPYVEASCNLALLAAYNGCLSSLVDLRKYHIQIVTKYIVIASKENNEGNFESLDSKGTGGTCLIPFLKEICSETVAKIFTHKANPTHPRKALVSHRNMDITMALITGAILILIVSFLIKIPTD